MGMRDTYAYAIQTAKGKFHGNAEERDGKLYFKGTVATEAEKNEIWTAIKTIPTWQKDIVADIQVTGGPAAAAAAPAAGRRQDLHGQGRRHAQRDCQRAPGQRRRLHEDLRAEQGPVDRSRQDQARPGPASAVGRLPGPDVRSEISGEPRVTALRGDRTWSAIPRRCGPAAKRAFVHNLGCSTKCPRE